MKCTLCNHVFTDEDDKIQLPYDNSFCCEICADEFGISGCYDEDLTD